MNFILSLTFFFLAFLHYRYRLSKLRKANKQNLNYDNGFSIILSWGTSLTLIVCGLSFLILALTE